jgi:aminopeptidase
MMDTDNRWQQLAEVLLQHSTETKKGDRVLIIMREVDTFPLARCVYREAVKAGAYPQVVFSSCYLERDLMAQGTKEQLDWIPELHATAMEWADVCVDLRAAVNPFEFEGIKPQVLAAHKCSEGRISALRTEKTRWILIRVPNASFAQQAGRSLEDTMEFFFQATLLDWKKESENYSRIQAALAGTESVRIVGAETDLSFSTTGRKYLIEDGRINMPGGEVYTAPLEDSTDGVIYFEHPGVYGGLLIRDIRLEFRGGEVVNAGASENEGLLHELLDMDAGSRRLGEFGFGTNPKITSFSNDILLDEKIYGTVHIALGRSYKECGGINESALHWDIIKDLRSSGHVLVDGKRVLDRGRYST